MTQVQKINISKPAFIKYISKIQDLASFNLSFGAADEATMADEVQKIDSVHDFGSTR